MRDNEQHQGKPHGTPSTAESETAKPDPIVEDGRSDGRTDRLIYGSEGSGGDNTPARPRERKRRT